MKKTEINCVDCGLPCLGDLCRNKPSIVHYCDECQTEIAITRMNDLDYCYSCATRYLQDLFEDLSLELKADAVGAVIQNFNDE